MKTFKRKICTLQQMIKEYLIFKFIRWQKKLEMLLYKYYLNSWISLCFSLTNPGISLDLSSPGHSKSMQISLMYKLHSLHCMLGYLSTDIICSEKQTVFREQGKLWALKSMHVSLIHTFYMYAQIFVHGHYLFWGVNSFPRA